MVSAYLCISVRNRTRHMFNRSVNKISYISTTFHWRTKLGCPRVQRDREWKKYEHPFPKEGSFVREGKSLKKFTPWIGQLFSIIYFAARPKKIQVLLPLTATCSFILSPALFGWNLSPRHFDPFLSPIRMRSAILCSVLVTFWNCFFPSSFTADLLLLNVLIRYFTILHFEINSLSTCFINFFF